MSTDISRTPSRSATNIDGELVDLRIVLDEDDVRQQAVDGLFDSLKRAARRLEEAAFEHGRHLTKPDHTEKSAARIRAAKNFDALLEATRRGLGQALHDAGAVVVHNTEEA